jgi:hypothetical protein
MRGDVLLRLDMTGKQRIIYTLFHSWRMPLAGHEDVLLLCVSVAWVSWASTIYVDIGRLARA